MASSPLWTSFLTGIVGLLVAVESVKLKKVKHRPRPMQHFDDSITQHTPDGSSTAVEKSVLENDEDSRSNVSVSKLLPPPPSHVIVHRAGHDDDGNVTDFEVELRKANFAVTVLHHLEHLSSFLPADMFVVSMMPPLLSTARVILHQIQSAEVPVCAIISEEHLLRKRTFMDIFDAVIMVHKSAGEKVNMIQRVIGSKHKLASVKQGEKLCDLATTFESWGTETEELLKIFIESMRQSIIDVRKCWDREDWKALRRVFHSMKTSAQYIGATKLHRTSECGDRLCRSLAENDQTEEGLKKRVEETMVTFSSECKAVLEEIEIWK